MAISSELRQLVWSRAAGLCEYCRMPDEFDPLPFAVDHIRPQFHHGSATAENLCVCCFSCNTFKAVNVAGHDPETEQLTRLFHPRLDNWTEHFTWGGPGFAGSHGNRSDDDRRAANQPAGAGRAPPLTSGARRVPGVAVI
jgi:hypothetical protein